MEALVVRGKSATKNDIFVCTMCLVVALWLLSLIIVSHFDKRIDRLERIIAPNRQAEIILSGL